MQDEPVGQDLDRHLDREDAHEPGLQFLLQIERVIKWRIARELFNIWPHGSYFPQDLAALKKNKLLSGLLLDLEHSLGNLILKIPQESNELR